MRVTRAARAMSRKRSVRMLEKVGVGAFAGARLGGGEGVELEVAGHVVGQNAELLPRAVGAVVVRGDDVEGELALELRDRLLLGAAAAMNSQCGPAELGWS